jgi:hypothetical protein
MLFKIPFYNAGGENTTFLRRREKEKTPFFKRAKLAERNKKQATRETHILIYAIHINSDQEFFVHTKKAPKGAFSM